MLWGPQIRREATGDDDDGYGNAVPMEAKSASTGTWKSRTEREIPTFPQPLVCVYQDEDGEDHDERQQRPIGINPPPASRLLGERNRQADVIATAQVWLTAIRR